MVRPSIGRQLWNIDGKYLGVVVEIDGGICKYKKPTGAIDMFIWKIKGAT